MAGPWQKLPPPRQAGVRAPREHASGEHAPRDAAVDGAESPYTQAPPRPSRRGEEVRLYGLNAVRALFESRPRRCANCT